MGRHGDHVISYMVTIVLTAIVYVVTLTFSAMAWSGTASVYQNRTSDIWRSHGTDISPPGGAYISLWIFVYVWQLTWLVYALSTLCRPGLDGYVYHSPTVTPIWVYVLYMATNIVCIGWWVVWDWKIFIPATIFLLIMAAMLSVGVYLSHWGLYRHQTAMLNFEMTTEVWLVRVLIQNGLALYTSWAGTLFWIVLATCVTDNSGLAQEKSSTVSLSFLTAQILIWFILDCVVLDRFMRYTVTPYVPVIWVLGGIVDLHMTSGGRNAIFSAVLFAVAIAMLVVKVILMAWRHVTKPLTPPYLGDVAIQDGYDVKHDKHDVKLGRNDSVLRNETIGHENEIQHDYI